jgi:hypothetical protein
MGKTPESGENNGAAESSGTSSLDVIIDIARSTMDLKKAQELTKAASDHLIESEPREQFNKYKLDRDLLSKRFGLTVKEIDTLAAPSFTAEDAQHLDWCFRLRDVAQSLKVEKLPPLQQAERALAWVTRQVALETLEEELLPASLVLQRGRGDARERALVFLDLLNQMELDGCILTCPGVEKGTTHYWLVGVVIKDDKQDEIHLFEPRLGLPVPGPGGKGIATLAQLKKQPELVQSLSIGKDYTYDVTPERAAKAEVSIACAMSALAPRMRYLDHILGKQGRISLAVDPTEWIQHLDKAAGAPVQVWNDEGNAKKSGSPLRTQAAFLPGAGMINKENQKFYDSLFYLASAKTHYRQLKVWLELPNKSARDHLLGLSRHLLEQYSLYPREKLTRGRLENMLPRLSRIDKILLELNRAQGKEALEGKIAEWRSKVEEVYSIDEKNPLSQIQRSALWSEDPYFRLIIAPANEEEELPKVEKRVLSFLVLTATAEALDKESLHLLALYWLEKAERSHNEISRFVASKTPVPKNRKDQAEMDWKNALKWTQKYLDRYGFAPGDDSWSSQMQSLQQQVDLAALDISIAEEFIKDVHRTLTLRLNQIDALRVFGQGAAADTKAQALAADAKKLCDSSELKDFLANFKTRVGDTKQLDETRREEYLKTLDQLAATLEPYGSVYWNGHAASARTSAAKK